MSEGLAPLRGPFPSVTESNANLGAWLATGGRSGVIDRVDILKNRKILVFADWLIR